MTSDEKAIRALEGSGLLDVLKWAAPAAFRATDQMYDEDQGHDRGVVGYLNYKHFTNRIDRATSNEQYMLGKDVDGASDDVVGRGITPDELHSMPDIPAGAIKRSNYKNSPGWTIPGYRVLLQSFFLGGIDEIKWEQRSNAKRQVASQPYSYQDALFEAEDFGLELLGGIPDDDAFDGVTLVAAHAFDPASKQFELYIGQSKNPEFRNDSCWYWKLSLLSSGTMMSVAGQPIPAPIPNDGASTEVEDVPVRIKKTTKDEGTGSIHD
ncbi:hypothetical protein [Brevibacterium renqingii]|uniref:hypothetical protein n=1 Tax=Brevibacterium renqingii TaxID=2776916 RepID=UPI001AE0149B|nr:hypothetical protein [Brevibacterium renqingii]